MKRKFNILSLFTAILLLIAAVLLWPSVAQAQTLGMVVDRTNKHVMVFDADSDTLVGSVALPAAVGPVHDCSILDDQSLGFVNDFNGRQVWVIDPSVPGLAAGTNPIGQSQRPLDTTISADQQFLLTTGNGPPFVSVIDIAIRSEITFFPVGDNIKSVEACSDNSVLISNRLSKVRRLTIDAAGNLTNTGEEVSVVPFNPLNVACGPSGGNGVAVGPEPAFAQSFTYPPLVPATSTLVAGDVQTVVISPDGSRVYVRGTNKNKTVEGFTYNEATGALGADPFVSFPVAFIGGGFGMDTMAIHPNGNKLYVSEGRPDRERALRARARGLHRCSRPTHRPLRVRPRRHLAAR